MFARVLVLSLGLSPWLFSGQAPPATVEHCAVSDRERHSACQAGAGRPHEEAEEDNAPRPPPRAGDSESQSTAPDILPDADGRHLHGRLGLLPDGSPRLAPTELPPGGLTAKERRDAHRGFCFNSRVSDSISLDRRQPDVRSPACVKMHSQGFPELPTASVILVFHNENLFALLRSVHSVLNHSPPNLLKQVIIVDDASTPLKDRFYKKHWKRLQAELTEYCKNLPKVLLVRLGTRRGLILARMEGIWRATSDVAVFLDSHIEATHGWLEPMLARIRENRTRVTIPTVDSIGNEDFLYRQGGGLGVLGFSWTLGQDPMRRPNLGPSGTQPDNSPIMSGGLLAADRKWFLKLGGYDTEMRLYGGEEMEISFRTWMCGGSIEYVPCSHVGHVFRTPDYWQGQVYPVPAEEIARNKLRTAEVWMDEYKQLVKWATMPLPAHTPLGDVKPRLDLREKLQCKTFQWYLDTVAPDMYVPTLTGDVHGGALANKKTGLCVDTMGERHVGAELSAYPCHGQQGAQALVMDGQGLVRIPTSNYRTCMALRGQRLVQIPCVSATDPAKWKYNNRTGYFRLAQKQGPCLEVVQSANERTLTAGKCAKGKDTQHWTWV